MSDYNQQLADLSEAFWTKFMVRQEENGDWVVREDVPVSRASTPEEAVKKARGVMREGFHKVSGYVQPEPPDDRAPGTGSKPKPIGTRQPKGFVITKLMEIEDEFGVRLRLYDLSRTEWRVLNKSTGKVIGEGHTPLWAVRSANDWLIASQNETDPKVANPQPHNYEF